MDRHANDAATAPSRGLLLDDRYRLEQVRHEHSWPHGAHGTLWRAVDTSLDRRVAVLVVTGLTAKRRRQLAAAATQASRVSDGRCVRVLDVGSVDLADGPATWVATEWVDAPTLTAVLRGAPLRPALATELVRQCAQALAVAERAGCHHGRLHPDQVLLPGTGLPRLTGLEVAAAVHDDPPVEPRTDVRGLGALLFAALTGRWPLPGWAGLPAASGRAASDGRPRHLRPEVSRELDDLTHRALRGEFADAQTFATALHRLPNEPLDAPAPPPPPSPWAAWRRWGWRILPPLLVVAVGLGGWVVGSQLGKVPTQARARQPALPSATASGAAALSPVWSAPPAITSFDPNGDGQENEDAVGLAVDRDSSTQWTTDTYRGDPHFGGLKDGVGLLIDLKRPVAVRVAELALSSPGADVEIRAGDAPPSKPSDLTLVASRDNASVSPRLALAHPVTARYWLVWFTSLPKEGGGYRIGVAEVALLG